MSSDLKVTNIKHADSTSNNLVLGSDGSATINQISSSSVFPAGGTGNPVSVAVICDKKDSTTDGGTFTSGAWQTRDLNTEISDPDGIVSIASNQFTLGAGTYLISWSATAYYVDRHISRLYDVTNTTGYLGTVQYAKSGVGITTSSTGEGIVTPSGSNLYEIQHRCYTSKSTNGFGSQSLGIDENIYCKVVIYKLK